VTSWARAVVGGRVVVGKTLGCAAERHLRDLKDGPSRGLYWDAKAAAHVIGWYPTMLTITAGTKAGAPFDLLQPHMFGTGSLFGWKRADGRRRFRTVYFESGKGQGKALALDTAIPTPTGWTTMGALRDGDAIFDDAGVVCYVLKAHPVMTGNRCYSLAFDDRSKIVADAGHLWCTEAPIAERQGWLAIQTTEEIALTFRNCSIVLAGELERKRPSGARRIVACDLVESVPVRCITASSASRMFLVGRSMVPTHNTPWMAATGLYLLRFSGVPRFEGYFVAGNENQSGVAIGEAAALATALVPGREQTFKEIAGLELRGNGALTWQVEWNGSDYGLGICILRNVSSGSQISGPKPAFVAADEVHEWNDRSILEIWTAALTKMPGDPLLMLGTNTPASDQIIGTEQSDYYTAVATGAQTDDSSLAMVCTCDEGDDPLNDERVWRKSLPAIGITYPADNVRDEITKARGLPSRALTIKRLFFGIRVGAADCWIDETTWRSVLGAVREEDVAGLPCWLGLDLSSRKDLTALAMVWRRPDGHYLARIHYWTPGDTLAARSEEDHAPYGIWAEQGHLTATPGPTIPKLWPATRVQRATLDYNVRMLAYDPAQILDFEEALTEIGLDAWRYEGPGEPNGAGLMMVRHGQGWQGMNNPALLAMPASVKAFEEVILNRGITIDDNPVTTFCSANMALKQGENPDQRVPTRRKSRGRIDGMVAVIEAVGGAVNGAATNSDSVYERRGLMVF
jgi:phage terminase large subunit-like protein